MFQSIVFNRIKDSQAQEILPFVKTSGDVLIHTGGFNCERFDILDSTTSPSFIHDKD